MKAPDIPFDEASRLAALRALKLLDTPAEEQYDRITRLALQLFSVPIALISLVDEHRQWFKSRQGVELSDAPRDISFCGHAILGPDVFEICNALEDERFHDNPLVTGPPQIRFYAGAPLKTLYGDRVGTLCIIDRRPRSLTQDEKQVLRDLGDLVQELFNRKEVRKVVSTVQAQGARLRTILDAVAEGILTIDDEGKVEDTNPAAAKMFGYSPEEMESLPMGCLLSNSDGLANSLTLDGLLAQADHGSIELGWETAGKRKDGSTFPMEISVSGTVINNHRIFTVVAHDISERKQIERLKDEFVSTVSHELRTPLTSILGSLGLLAGGVAGQLPQPAVQLVDIARKNGDRLLRLINDLLDMEKIESGRMTFHLEDQPLLAILQQAIESNRAYAERLGVAIALKSTIDDLLVCVDADRFQQVIANLLSNAAKFSPPNGTVEVSVDRTAKGIRIAITDRGPGIPEELRPRLFRKFCQADSSDSRRKGGTGLGLAITKSLVESMGGAIGFDSRSGATSFWVEFPEALP